MRNMENCNRLVVSRASTAIYLILSAEGIRSRKVVVPANLCYAAIYPVIYSGNTPLFCDVDSDSGNTNWELINDSIKRSEDNNVAAIILPHMYGKCIPKHDIDEISENCRRNNILLIEDCASSLGAHNCDLIAGSVGDYAIYSFGYSKTIDLGSGGMLTSCKDISRIKDLYCTLPPVTEADHDNEHFYSRLYRLIRNNPQQDLGRCIWRSLLPEMKSVFVNRLDDVVLEKQINDCFDHPDEYISKRRDQQKQYCSMIKWNDHIRPYVYEDGDVPWRFSFFVDPDIRRDLIDHLLGAEVPISDWYPIVTPIFGTDNSTEDLSLAFPGAYYMQERLLNLPVCVDDVCMKKYTDAVNAFFEG